VIQVFTELFVSWNVRPGNSFIGRDGNGGVNVADLVAPKLAYRFRYEHVVEIETFVTIGDEKLEEGHLGETRREDRGHRLWGVSDRMELVD
jgi:methionine aminopeptidase